MAQWDLTPKMAPFLDRHLVFPLLEFLSVKGIYDETDLLRAKLDLLSHTNMVDFIMDVHKSLYPDQEVPANLKEKRTVASWSGELPGISLRSSSMPRAAT